MLKRIAIILAALAVASCTGSLKKVKITSFELESVSPCGLREVNAVINIGIDNPSVKFVVQDLNAILKYEGEECMYFEGSRVDVAAGSNDSYRVLVHGELSKEFNPFVIFGILKSKDMDSFKLDVSGTANFGGIKKKLTRKDIPVKDLLKKI